jgi:hypothetical protein
MNPFVAGGTGYPVALLADGHTVRAHVRSIASAGRLPAQRHALRARRAHSAGRDLLPRRQEARPGLFLATFMLLLDITVVNAALPSIQGEES